MSDQAEKLNINAKGNLTLKPQEITGKSRIVPQKNMQLIQIGGPQNVRKDHNPITTVKAGPEPGAKTIVHYKNVDMASPGALGVSGIQQA